MNSLQLDDLVDVTIRGARVVGVLTDKQEEQFLRLTHNGIQYFLLADAANFVMDLADGSPLPVWAVCTKCRRELRLNRDGVLPGHQIKPGLQRSPFCRNRTEFTTVTDARLVGSSSPAGA